MAEVINATAAGSEDMGRKVHEFPWLVAGRKTTRGDQGQPAQRRRGARGVADGKTCPLCTHSPCQVPPALASSHATGIAPQLPGLPSHPPPKRRAGAAGIPRVKSHTMPGLCTQPHSGLPS